MPSSSYASQSGHSLVEAAMVLAITSVTLGLAIPTFEQMRSRIHLRGATAQLETDLQFARSSAVALNRVVQVTFDEGPTNTCYVVHTGSPHDCTCATHGRPVCTNGAEQLRSVQVPASSGFELVSNSRNIGFEPIHGMVTPTATVTATSRLQERINVIINIMGRVRTCSPTDSLGGLPRC